MNRKVTYALLHQGAFLPGVGALGTTFPPTKQTLDGLTMTAVDAGLLIEFTVKAIRYEILIPSPNVVLMKLVPEEKPSPIKITKAA